MPKIRRVQHGNLMLCRPCFRNQNPKQRRNPISKDTHVTVWISPRSARMNWIAGGKNRALHGKLAQRKRKQYKGTHGAPPPREVHGTMTREPRTTTTKEAGTGNPSAAGGKLPLRRHAEQDMRSIKRAS